MKHPQIENIIQRWVQDTYNNHNIPPISFEVYGKNIYIYSSSPGILIGKYGTNIEQLKNTLKENKIKKNIRFIELGNSYGIREINIRRRLW